MKEEKIDDNEKSVDLPKTKALCGNNTLDYCLSNCHKLDGTDLPNLWCKKLKEYIN